MLARLLAELADRLLAELAERLLACEVPADGRLLPAALLRLLVPAVARLPVDVRPRAWSLETRLVPEVAPCRCATSWLR
ncbi:hypothetical protein D3C83_132100 [compost metagenome]